MLILQPPTGLPRTAIDVLSQDALQQIEGGIPNSRAYCSHGAKSALFLFVNVGWYSEFQLPL